MTNVRRLVDAGTGFESDHALAFVFELNPALENVDKLELGLVQVRLARKLLARRRADDMGVDSSLRRNLDPEVAVLVEGA